MADDSGEPVREVVEGVVGTDMLVKGNGPAFLQNLSYQSAVNFQQAMNAELLGAVGLNQAGRAKAIDLLLNTSAAEGVTDSTIAGIMAKVMGNTPPVTP